MFRKLIAYLLLIFLVSVCQVCGQLLSVNSLFEQGNTAYQNEDYSKAIDCYEQIIKSGTTNHKVYYNLGNAYFKEGVLGKAITNYNRALKLSPRDEDASANLKFARLFATDKIQEKNQHFFSRQAKRFTDFWSLNELGLFVTLAYFGLIALILFRICYRLNKRAFTLIAPILIFLVAIGGLGFTLKLQNVSLEKGVILENEVDIKSGPGQDWTSQLVAHQGLELAIKGEVEGWYQVSLPNQIIGWVPKVAVEKI